MWPQVDVWFASALATALVTLSLHRAHHVAVLSVHLHVSHPKILVGTR
jgi:hypothetical protein